MNDNRPDKLRLLTRSLTAIIGLCVDLVWVAGKTLGLLLGALLGVIILGLALIAIGTKIHPIVFVGVPVVGMLVVVLALIRGNIYRHFLLRIYLRRKLTPLFAASAVMLCTAMVIVVISVMGGFESMMQQSARRLSGDVIIGSSLTGFPHYEQLLQRLRAMPEVDAATPIIRSYGLIKLHDYTGTVQVEGIDPETFDRVTGYRNTLQWSSADHLNHFEKLGEIGLQVPQRIADYMRENEILDLSMRFEPAQVWTSPQRDQRGIVLGIAFSPYNVRTSDGGYVLNYDTISQSVTLTVVPLTEEGAIVASQAVEKLTVVNEFKSGLLEVDRSRVYVPFDVLQRMLRMDAYEAWTQEPDPITGEPRGERILRPGRATEIMIRAREGINEDVLRDKVERIARDFVSDYPSAYLSPPVTWRHRHQDLLNAIAKEKMLISTLFGFVSLVAAAMIGVIFYMIVLEKTRDIGVLRAVGASRSGIATIFVGYGFMLGCIGSLMGLALAAVFVNHINDVQDLVDAGVKLMTGGEHGFRMWDPQFYYFDRIPARLDAMEVSIIMFVAVVASVVASVVPAVLASRLNPVEALRYE